MKNQCVWSGDFHHFLIHSLDLKFRLAPRRKTTNGVFRRGCLHKWRQPKMIHRDRQNEKSRKSRFFSLVSLYHFWDSGSQLWKDLSDRSWHTFLSSNVDLEMIHSQSLCIINLRPKGAWVCRQKRQISTIFGPMGRLMSITDRQLSIMCNKMKKKVPSDFFSYTVLDRSITDRQFSPKWRKLRMIHSDHFRTEWFLHFCAECIPSQNNLVSNKKVLHTLCTKIITVYGFARKVPGKNGSCSPLKERDLYFP